MGQIHYPGRDDPIRVNDRALAHLKVVITTRMRRHEAFCLSWNGSSGEGTETIWIAPEQPLRYEFDDTEPHDLDPRWLERLVAAANQTGGVRIDDLDSSVEEPPSSP
jgi:hypothetical protein